MSGCEICGRGVPQDNVSLFRANKLGETPAIWRCREHLNFEVDAEVEDIVSIIETTNRNITFEEN